MQSDLLPGAVKNYLLPITEPEFFEYVMVRITSLLPSVKGNTIHYNIIIIISILFIMLLEFN